MKPIEFSHSEIELLIEVVKFLPIRDIGKLELSNSDKLDLNFILKKLEGAK